MKIAIDTGHCLSGADTGASGNGYREEICTREIGSKVISKLKALGHTVTLISPDYAASVNESLNTRINREIAANVDICVSIHLNAGGGQGVEIYTYKGQSFKEATNILNNLVTLGYRNRGIKDGSSLALVGRTKSTAMLVECCFIDSASDMNMYNSEKFADAIVKGLVGSTTSTPDTPSTPNPPSTGGTRYLNLKPNVDSWRIYPLNKAPVIGNEVGKLAPSKFGGLSYAILGNPQTDVYTIQTSDFGKVNIYAPAGGSSTITSSPAYSNTSNSGSNNNVSNKRYLNLNSNVASWRVYPLSKAPVIGNEVGKLAPSKFGGLSYAILGNPQTDVYTIQTSDFGKVNIYTPKDGDSSITSYPKY